MEIIFSIGITICIIKEWLQQQYLNSEDDD